ncbi:hypothetical protein GS399_18010 [Pedobacter sp. HMF7647]|uniref:Uncharacterized protein n=1 Tax=Hufsiella arboris TaxID=2695275 RepID=A0A7K1YE69_9SPHI|nr:hypothetical protein [Hufsiella arboris]MXV52872.1 hypothetical protein [Hufsiella arboris]
MDFINSVNNFLTQTGLTFHKENPLQTPFNGFYIPAKKILINCVDLSTAARICVPASYFSDLNVQAAEYNLKIIQLWEDQWEQQQPKVISRLSALLGLSNRIHGRQTTIVRLAMAETATFLNENHLQGATSAYYKFGLVKENQLLAIATFGKSRTMYDGPVYYRSYELERYTSKLGSTVVGGLSKLLGHFISSYSPAHIMTYADRDWGEGDSYSKLGFANQGIIEPQPFFIDLSSNCRYNSNQLKKLPPESKIQKFHNSGSRKWVLDRRELT